MKRNNIPDKFITLITPDYADFENPHQKTLFIHHGQITPLNIFK